MTGRLGRAARRRPGIAPFERLVAPVMAQAPYRSAPRVCWIVDTGSSVRELPCNFIADGLGPLEEIEERGGEPSARRKQGGGQLPACWWRSEYAVEAGDVRRQRVRIPPLLVEDILAWAVQPSVVFIVKAPVIFSTGGTGELGEQLAPSVFPLRFDGHVEQNRDHRRLPYATA